MVAWFFFLAAPLPSPPCRSAHFLVVPLGLYGALVETLLGFGEAVFFFGFFTVSSINRTVRLVVDAKSSAGIPFRTKTWSEQPANKCCIVAIDRGVEKRWRRSISGTITFGAVLLDGEVNKSIRHGGEEVFIWFIKSKCDILFLLGKVTTGSEAYCDNHAFSKLDSGASDAWGNAVVLAPVGNNINRRFNRAAHTLAS